jgi:hypothetical protein
MTRMKTESLSVFFIDVYWPLEISKLKALGVSPRVSWVWARRFSHFPTDPNPSFLRKGWKAYETLGGRPKALPYHSLFAQVCCAGKAAFQSMPSRW